ncbi:3-hydroxyacyl-CoA dehydrogenase family protein [Shimia sediminis]|uniref:3-hydroxyacyl-CoA dehydrogenase family protein n=1 Tax=Shimia sediminis TaxID=2497945 RepID=UPI000F8E2E42|nr:3-hydroxyacyl-CoA dehydrogenase family protein [Shimia sediminis]
MNGLNQPWLRRAQLANDRDPHERRVAIGDRLCDGGRFGQKAGRGYYLYTDGNPKGVQDPEVIALIRAERERKGITARGFKPEEIQRRCLAAMANEGARLLREGVAIRPSDIDTVMIHGFGFPRWRGGPMMAADLAGLLTIQRDLHLFEQEEPEFWAPDAIFAELIKTGRGFESLNG